MADSSGHHNSLSELQILFRSGIILKILIALRDGPKNIMELSLYLSIIPAVLHPKLHILKDKGFIEDNERAFALTNCGKIFSNKFFEVLETVNDVNPLKKRTPHHNADGTPDIRILEKNYIFLRSLILSRLSFQVLLLLNNRITDKSTVRERCKTRSSTIRPKIKQLVDYHLIEDSDYDYSITESGSLIAVKLDEMQRMMTVVLNLKEFLNKHSFNQIPDDLLLGIGDLSHAVVYYDTPMSVEKDYELYNKLIGEATFYYGISGWSAATAAESITSRVKEGMICEIIVDTDLFEQMLKPPFIDKIQELKPYPNIKIWISPTPLKFGCTIMDGLFAFKPIMKNENHYSAGRIVDWDPDPSSIDWGMRLFHYYKERSLPASDFMTKTGICKSIRIKN